MKKHLIRLMVLATFFSLVLIIPASGQAPPPPAHSQNGNQASPGGTGCPVDQTSGIIFALVLCLGYAGFMLYQRGCQEKKTVH